MMKIMSINTWIYFPVEKKIMKNKLPNIHLFGICTALKDKK